MMKTIFTILTVAGIAILFAFNEPTRNSSGALPGHTGSPGDGKNCTFCHGGTASPLSDVISSNIPASGYVPGEYYSITVTTSGAGRKGFQVSPQNVAGDLLGTLTAGAGNKLVGNGKYVTHSSGVLTPTAEWSFAWTAPAAGTGDVTFYGAFVISQPNVFVSSMTVQEGSALTGDANCDGLVNVLDVVSIANYVMGLNPEPFCPENADVNGDGIINTLDLVLTVNLILGK
jgi:hypothetical protein